MVLASSNQDLTSTSAAILVLRKKGISVFRMSVSVCVLILLQIFIVPSMLFLRSHRSPWMSFGVQWATEGSNGSHWIQASENAGLAQLWVMNTNYFFLMLWAYNRLGQGMWVSPHTPLPHITLALKWEEAEICYTLSGWKTVIWEGRGRSQELSAGWWSISFHRSTV